MGDSSDSDNHIDNDYDEDLQLAIMDSSRMISTNEADIDKDQEGPSCAKRLCVTVSKFDDQNFNRPSSGLLLRQINTLQEPVAGPSKEPTPGCSTDPQPSCSGLNMPLDYTNNNNTVMSLPTFQYRVPFPVRRSPPTAPPPYIEPRHCSHAACASKRRSLYNILRVFEKIINKLNEHFNIDTTKKIKFENSKGTQTDFENLERTFEDQTPSSEHSDVDGKSFDNVCLRLQARLSYLLRIYEKFKIANRYDQCLKGRKFIEDKSTETEPVEPKSDESAAPEDVKLNPPSSVESETSNIICQYGRKDLEQKDLILNIFALVIEELQKIKMDSDDNSTVCDNCRCFNQGASNPDTSTGTIGRPPINIIDWQKALEDYQKRNSRVNTVIHTTPTPDSPPPANVEKESAQAMFVNLDDSSSPSDMEIVALENHVGNQEETLAADENNRNDNENERDVENGHADDVQPVANHNDDAAS